MNVTTVQSRLKELHGPAKGQLCHHPLQAAAGSLLSVKAGGIFQPSPFPAMFSS